MSPLYCFIQLLIPWMSPLYCFIQLLIPWMRVPYSNWFIQLLIPWMSPLFQLVLYSDGRPYLVALFIQQLVLFNNCFIPMAALIWSHFLFNNWGFIQLFYSTAYSLSLIPTVLFNSCSPDGRPYSTAYSLSLIPTGRPYLVFFSFFYLWKKRCLTWDSNPGPLDLQSGCLPLDHHHTHHHHNFKAVIKLITTPLIWSPFYSLF